VIINAAKLDLLRSLGAGRVYDYNQGNYLAGGEIYDAIIDVVGKSSYADCMRHLNPRGRYVLGNPGMLASLRASMT
jgi:NADPH:quinone reductase-like Zn-dependent oxidoreductase